MTRVAITVAGRHDAKSAVILDLKAAFVADLVAFAQWFDRDKARLKLHHRFESEIRAGLPVKWRYTEQRDARSNPLLARHTKCLARRDLRPSQRRGRVRDADRAIKSVNHSPEALQLSFGRGIRLIVGARKVAHQAQLGNGATTSNPVNQCGRLLRSEAETVHSRVEF